MQNLGILLTRPLSQAHHLCEFIRQAGGNPIAFPTLIIQDIDDKTHLMTAITALKNADIAIFISPNAIAKTGDLIKNSWPTLPIQLKFAAIGEGTAHALRSQGFLVDIVPTHTFNTEGLLALADFQQISAKKITVFRGEGGRTLLTNTLRERGAEVTEAIAYRRSCPQVDCSPLLAKWHANEIGLIISTSQESLVNLITMLGQENQRLVFNTPLLVSSPRLAAFAQELGFKHSPIIAENASDKAIAHALGSVKK